MHDPPERVAELARALPATLLSGIGRIPTEVTMRGSLLGAIIATALLAGCATEAPHSGGYAYGYDYSYDPGYYGYGPVYSYGPDYYEPGYFGFSYRSGDGGHRWGHWDGGSRSWHQGSVQTPRSSSHTVVHSRVRGGNRLAHGGAPHVSRNNVRRDRAERQPNRVASARHRPDGEHGGSSPPAGPAA